MRYVIYASDKDGTFYVGSRDTVLTAVALANHTLGEYGEGNGPFNVTEVKIFRASDWTVVFHKEV